MGQEELITRILSSGAPIIGAPALNFGVAITGNQQLDMLLAPLISNFGGPGKFLPQLAPAQNMLDGMAAAQYRSATIFNSEKLRERDNKALATTFEGLRNITDGTPITEAGRAELLNFAGYVNNKYTKPIISSLIGPQNMEDLFFGQRGSAEMLGDAVNQIGLYRPDPVTGNNRMTRKSLETFSDQIYSNLYGDSTQISDVAGFSAGRVGTLMTDLARRRLLPESYSRLDPKARKDELDAGLREEIAALKLPDEVSAALNDDTKLVGDIERLPGGADAIRKVDATRVSRSLKEYTKAIGVVREIFGDNGITNAPMGQLLAAMDALTQNSMSSMKPAQIAGLMRRTQMAARDTGVSLEGLLGLTARAGALADKYDLPRELAAENVITAMERVKGMGEAGGFRPGFGRPDADKAAAAALDQNMRAQSSTIGRYVAAAQRAELGGLVKDGSDLQKMLAALRAGERAMTLDGETVDIYTELAKNPAAFLNPMFEAAGVSEGLVRAYLRDPNTREALGHMPNFQPHLSMADEAKKIMGDRLMAGDHFYTALADTTPAADRRVLADELSQTFGAAVIDDVDTRQTESARIDAGRERLRSVFLRKVRADPGNAGLPRAELIKKADELMDASFGGRDAVNQAVAKNLAVAGSIAKSEIGYDLPEMQAYFARAATDAGVATKKEHIARARLFGAAGPILTSDGSNFLQRFSDAIADKSDMRGALDKFLGVVDSADVIETIKRGTNIEHATRFDNIFDRNVSAYEAAVIDTEKEREDFIAKVMTGEMSLADAAEYFQGHDEAGHAVPDADFSGKTRVMTAADVHAHIREKAAATDGSFDDALDAYNTKYGHEFDATKPEHFARMETIAPAALGLAPDVMTEHELRQKTRQRSVDGALVVPDKRKDIENHKAFDRFIQAMTQTRGGDYAHVDLIAGLGYGDKDFAKNDEAMALLKKAMAGDDAAAAKFEELARLPDTATEEEKAARQYEIDDILAVRSVYANIKAAGTAAGGLTSAANKARVDASRAFTKLKDINSRIGVFAGAEDGGIKTMLAKDKLDAADYQKFDTAEERLDLIRAGAAHLKPVAGKGFEYGKDAAGKPVYYESREALVEKISAETEAAVGEKRTGPLGDMFSGLSASLSEAVKTVFTDSKLDVKFGTVTVQTLQLNAAAAEIAAASPAAVDKPLEITGTVTIDGSLTEAVVNIVNKRNGDMPINPHGGGSQVMHCG